MRQIKKTIYLVNIGKYEPKITKYTYPLIEKYAQKIGADIVKITERKFPEFPVVYEKLQIYELAQKNQSDWNIYIDSDAMIHPETIDFTNFLKKDTILHHGTDMANIRWTYDGYFLRDGRNIGSCNWFTMASDWCIDLWKPLDDITYKQALDMIHPIQHELNTVITRSHLIDDFTLSRNIAKFGLKVDTAMELIKRVGLPSANFFWHEYTLTSKEKTEKIAKVYQDWAAGK